MLEATAHTSNHGLTPKKRGLPPAQRYFMTCRQVTISAVRRACAASSGVFTPPEIQPVQWRSCIGHAKAGCVLEVTARTSHHGLTPKNRGYSPVQCPSISHNPTAISVARHAWRGKLACFATSRETAGAVTRARVQRESRVRVGSHSLYIEPRSHTEWERPSVGAMQLRYA